MRRTLCILCALLWGLATGWAQRSAKDDFEFGNYLIGNGLLREAVTLTHNLSEDYTPAALDTMRYLKGWTHYQMRNFRSAADAFGLVSDLSPLYAKSTFFGAISLLEEEDVAGAEERLTRFGLTPQAETHRELLAFERSGVALLKGDRQQYKALQEEFTYSNPLLVEQQRALDNLALNAPRHLSPWVAGVASAVMPGLGKIYAGDVGGGVASLLLVGAFSALAVEGYNRTGTIENWRTLTYGAVASLLYVGNIWGSVASVRIYYQNFEEINRQAVMYSIHIPLRDIFF